MESAILPIIDSMNKLGANQEKVTYSFKIDGYEYWIQIDIVKMEDEEDNEEIKRN